MVSHAVERLQSTPSSSATTALTTSLMPYRFPAATQLFADASTVLSFVAPLRICSVEH